MGQDSHVLIVEDTLAWQKRLQRHLKRLGLTADVAQDLAEARRLLEGRIYKLVTVDINLAENDPHNQDGLEILELLAERGITTIVIRASGEDVHRGSRRVIEEKYRPFAYFLKYQYNYNDFRAVVEQALSTDPEQSES